MLAEGHRKAAESIENRHIHAPREVNVMFATRTLQEWDPEFVVNVAREGIVLYQRGAVLALFAA